MGPNHARSYNTVGLKNGWRPANDITSVFQLVNNYRLRQPLPMHDHAQYKNILTINPLLIPHGTQNPVHAGG